MNIIFRTLSLIIAFGTITHHALASQARTTTQEFFEGIQASYNNLKPMLSKPELTNEKKLQGIIMLMGLIKKYEKDFTGERGWKENKEEFKKLKRTVEVIKDKFSALVQQEKQPAMQAQQTEPKEIKQTAAQQQQQQVEHKADSSSSETTSSEEDSSGSEDNGRPKPDATLLKHLNALLQEDMKRLGRKKCKPFTANTKAPEWCEKHGITPDRLKLHQMRAVSMKHAEAYEDPQQTALHEKYLQQLQATAHEQPQPKISTAWKAQPKQTAKATTVQVASPQQEQKRTASVQQTTQSIPATLATKLQGQFPHLFKIYREEILVLEESTKDSDLARFPAAFQAFAQRWAELNNVAYDSEHKLRAACLADMHERTALRKQEIACMEFVDKHDFKSAEALCKALTEAYEQAIKLSENRIERLVFLRSCKEVLPGIVAEHKAAHEASVTTQAQQQQETLPAAPTLADINRGTVATTVTSTAAATTSAQEQKNKIACAHCKKEGASQSCARCLKVSYCDRTCQTLHWSAHKQDCRKASTATVAKPGVTVVKVSPDYSAHIFDGKAWREELTSQRPDFVMLLQNYVQKTADVLRIASTNMLAERWLELNKTDRITTQELAIKCMLRDLELRIQLNEAYEKLLKTTSDTHAAQLATCYGLLEDLRGRFAEEYRLPSTGDCRTYCADMREKLRKAASCNA